MVKYLQKQTFNCQLKTMAAWYGILLYLVRKLVCNHSKQNKLFHMQVQCKRKKKRLGDIGAGSQPFKSPVCQGSATAPPMLKPKTLEAGTADPYGFTVIYPLLDKGPQEDGWFFQATDARLTRANHLHFPNENSLSAITGSLNTFLFQALLEEETVVSDRREFQKTICSECPYHFCGNCGEAKSGGGHQQYFGYI